MGSDKIRNPLQCRELNRSESPSKARASVVLIRTKALFVSGLQFFASEA